MGMGNRIEFTEESSDGELPERPPGNSMLHPFWLMRILSKSMIHGGYMTPDIWLSPTTWNLTGSKGNLAVSTKLSSNQSLISLLAKLNEVNMEDQDSVTRVS